MSRPERPKIWLATEDSLIPASWSTLSRRGRCSWSSPSGPSPACPPWKPPSAPRTAPGCAASNCPLGRGPGAPARALPSRGGHPRRSLRPRDGRCRGQPVLRGATHRLLSGDRGAGQVRGGRVAPGPLRPPGAPRSHRTPCARPRRPSRLGSPPSRRRRLGAGARAHPGRDRRPRRPG